MVWYVKYARLGLVSQVCCWVCWFWFSRMAEAYWAGFAGCNLLVGLARFDLVDRVCLLGFAGSGLLGQVHWVRFTG